MGVTQKSLRRLAVALLVVFGMIAVSRATLAAQVEQPAGASQTSARERPPAKPTSCCRISRPSTSAASNGRTLLMGGLVVCALGLGFGLFVFTQLKNLPVHASMREVSELIYETCKTYLITQGKFILILEIFIGVIMVFYFGVLSHLEPLRVAIILIFSLIGIGGSYGVAWFGIRVNTFANSRAAFAEPARQAVPDLRDPAARRA
jgi:hypothetical protein